MSNDEKIVLAPNGTERKELLVKDIEIDDLWHIAMGIEDGKCKNWSKEDRKLASKEILRVWHLAHDLKNHIMEK